MAVTEFTPDYYKEVMFFRISSTNSCAMQGQTGDLIFLHDGFDEAAIFKIVQEKDIELSPVTDASILSHFQSLVKPYFIDLGRNSSSKNHIMLIGEVGQI